MSQYATEEQQQHDKPLASHQTSAAAKYEKDDSPRNEESSSKHTDNDQVDTFGLQRTVGLAGSISINLGTMIGSGIFISPQGVLYYAGSVGLSLCIWTFTGLVAMMGGLCYAELGTLIGKSAGEFVYLQQAYGGGLAFMSQFVTLFVVRPGSQAIMAMTCAQYILALFFSDDCGGAPTWIVKLLAIAVVWIIVFVNCKSATSSNSVQVIFTVAKVAALGIIILGGIVMLARGNTENFKNSFEGSNWKFSSLVLSFYSAYFAFDGWQMANSIVEEIKNPKRNVPIAVLSSVAAATVLYVLTNISYFSVLTADELLASDAVAISWAQKVMPNFVWTMPVAVAMSIFGSFNGSVFSGGRSVYRAGREGHLPSILAMISVKYLTPFPAILLNALITTIYILPTDIQPIMDMLGFIMWTTDAFVFAGIVVFRYTKPDSDPKYKRTFKCPIVIPIFMTLLSAFFVFVPLVADPQLYYFYGLAMFVGSLVLYFPFVYYHKTISGLG